MTKSSTILLLSLLAAIGAFLIGAPSAEEIKPDGFDEREAVVLAPAEKSYVLTQMRLFVESIRVIAEDLAEGDLAKAADAAAARGMKRNANDPAFPATLRAKLPDAWKRFGQGLRQGFDGLAQGLANGEDARQSLKQLSQVMTNCIGCHAAYRVVDAQP